MSHALCIKISCRELYIMLPLFFRQKEVDAFKKENESLKSRLKQKDARLAVLSESFDR